MNPTNNSFNQTTLFVINFSIGARHGYSQGLETGKEDGYNDLNNYSLRDTFILGYDTGYNIGYKRGLNDAEEYHDDEWVPMNSD